MKILVLKENKNDHRVSLVPADVQRLVAAKHEVYVQEKAGVDIGYSDQSYLDVGAKIIKKVNALIPNVNVVLKNGCLKNNQLKLLKPEQIV